jgi:hypothetical protein
MVALDGLKLHGIQTTVYVPRRTCPKTEERFPSVQCFLVHTARYFMFATTKTYFQMNYKDQSKES